MGNYLDKDGLTRFKEKLLTEVDERIEANSGGDFLPLSGGTMTGNLKSSSKSWSIQKTTTDGNLTLRGGTSIDNGAILVLGGKDDSTYLGQFFIRATNASANSSLVGYPDGKLTWGGKHIVRTVNGSTADASGNVTISLPTPKAYVTETWSSGKNWYRKYSDGWIEQGGSISFSNDSHANSVTFPVAFSNTNYTLTFGIISTSTGGLTFGMAGVKSITATGYVLWANAAYITKTWYACGY